MLVKDLFERLKGKEDFDIQLIETDFSTNWPTIKSFDIIIGDIGFSEKVILIEKSEEI